MPAMKQQFSCALVEELSILAPQLITFCESRRVIAFYGEMGAGKTTFIKAICHYLGVAENVSSPTFSLVNEYKTKQLSSVFHFDFYRIRSLQEAIDIGCEEYFDSGDFCFVEWPEKILYLLPEDTVSVTIDVKSGIRLISFAHE